MWSASHVNFVLFLYSLFIFFTFFCYCSRCCYCCGCCWCCCYGYCFLHTIFSVSILCIIYPNQTDWWITNRLSTHWFIQQMILFSFYFILPLCSAALSVPWRCRWRRWIRQRWRRLLRRLGLQESVKLLSGGKIFKSNAKFNLCSLVLK